MIDALQPASPGGAAPRETASPDGTTPADRTSLPNRIAMPNQAYRPDGLHRTGRTAVRNQGAVPNQGALPNLAALWNHAASPGRTDLADWQRLIMSAYDERIHRLIARRTSAQQERLDDWILISACIWLGTRLGQQPVGGLARPAPENGRQRHSDQGVRQANAGQRA